MTKQDVQNKNSPHNSDRAFGFFFTFVFLALSAYFYLSGDKLNTFLILTLALICFFCSIFCAKVLHPLNVAWFKLGILLHRIISPIVLAVLYFVLITPIAFIVRLKGRDELNLSKDVAVDSYWIKRGPNSPTSESMRKQY